MDPGSIMATLYFQMEYRVQNHAMDLSLPGVNDALMISTDSHNAPIVAQIPKQIPIEDLKRLLPSSWITNYKRLYTTPVPVQSTEPIFTQMKDNSTLITFKKSEKKALTASQLNS